MKEAQMQSEDNKGSEDLPWFRRCRPDGRPEPHATRGDNGEILILDGAWAASFKNGTWHDGILFFHDQIAEFSPVKNRDEIYRLFDQARTALGTKGEQNI
jgi:hypothetical protein